MGNLGHIGGFGITGAIAAEATNRRKRTLSPGSCAGIFMRPNAAVYTAPADARGPVYPGATHKRCPRFGKVNLQTVSRLSVSYWSENDAPVTQRDVNLKRL